MKNYYFTFGQDHWHKEGIPMKNFWVRVQAHSYEEARVCFIEKFSSLYMQTPSTWSFQYEEFRFRKEYFPGGEFMLLNAPASPNLEEAAQ
jgi:hypothetical protein